MKKYSLLLLLFSAIVAFTNPVSAVPGDVTGDGKVDIADGIRGLQIMDRTDQAGQTININADVNNDGKIGMDEVINILQCLSGARPFPLEIILTTPANLASEVAANTIVAARFNKSVDVTTVNTSTITLKNAENLPITGSVYCNGRTVQFIPSVNLAMGAYTATITTGVKDLSGNTLGSNVSWSFTTTATVAPSGSLDTTFGIARTGTVTISFGGSEEEARAIALQPDGKTVVGGFANFLGISKFALMRLNPDGLLDTSFGSNGIVTTTFASSTWDTIFALAVQEDGKIVAAGGYNAFALARYNSDGSLDNSFGFRGTVRTNAGVYQAAAYSIAIQSDGKIIAGGWSDQNSPYGARFTLIRYNSDGSLDTTFGSEGVSRTLVGGYQAVIRSVSIQTDGKIAAAGYTSNGLKFDFAFVRFNNDGTVDTSFGNAGVVIVPVSTGNDTCYALGLQSDGSIVGAGETVNGSVGDLAVVRLSSQGNLDLNFGSGGKVITDFGVDNRAYGLAIQLDSRLVTVGFAFNQGFALTRYNTDGSLDATFGSGGKVATNAEGLSLAYAVVIQDDGRIVAAGLSSTGNKDFAVARFMP